MHHETQRIAIAEACGLKHLFTCEQEGYYFGTLMSLGGKPVPDYLNDLNAMHEAEKVLTITQYDTFALHLNRLCNESRVLSASAAQRAEAFLRTLGLWKDKP